jgi:hypothetical protein
MCIFSARVKNVSKTCILIAKSKESYRVVYANKVACDNGNVMVLPIPSDDVKLIELDDSFKTFSKKLSEEYEVYDDFINPKLCLKSWGNSSKFKAPIIKYGPYDVSITKDLDSVQWQHYGGLENKKEFYDLMSKQYNNYNFLIAKIRPEEKEKSYDSDKLPICYEFVSKETQVMIPTFHIHEGKAEGKPDWDHLICVINGKINDFKDYTMTTVDTMCIAKFFPTLNNVMSYFAKTNFKTAIVSATFMQINKYSQIANKDLICVF